MKVLVTGGTGYIGSNTCVELLKNGYDVVIVDNLSNSKQSVVSDIIRLGGKTVTFYPYDICDIGDVERIFAAEKIDAVIHFAGLKAVGESVEKPLLYYNNNLVGILNLLKIMEKNNVKKLVFSSSATVYGDPKSVPIFEDFPCSTTNPYGATKLMQEEILSDLCAADKKKSNKSRGDSSVCNSAEDWHITLLRYFNPVGANESGSLGENPVGIPNNLMPYIVKVAQGKLEKLNVFGDDYPTADGTGVRDYIHVSDLARGHIAALNQLESAAGGVYTYNLGTGKGNSVLELIKAFEKYNGVAVPYKITKRRAGDIAVCYADTGKAYRELGWKAEKSLEDMCKSTWKAAQNDKPI